MVRLLQEEAEGSTDHHFSASQVPHHTKTTVFMYCSDTTKPALTLVWVICAWLQTASLIRAQTLSLGRQLRIANRQAVMLTKVRNALYRNQQSYPAFITACIGYRTACFLSSSASCVPDCAAG